MLGDRGVWEASGFWGKWSLPRCGKRAWTRDLAVLCSEFLQQALGTERTLYVGFLQNSSDLFNGTECIRQNAMNGLDESRQTALFTDYASVPELTEKSFIC